MGDRGIDRRFKRRKPLVFKLGVGGAIIALILLVLFFYFRVTDLQISESNYYSKEALQTYFVKDKLDQNTFLLYIKLKYRQKVAIPFIQKYDVDILGGNSIRITVYDKTIAGCVSYMGEYIYFDKDGMVLEITKDLMEGVPLITGIHYKEMSLYDTLAVEDEQVFSTIMNMSQLIKRYEIPVDKVVFDAYQNITIVIDDIKVTLGKREKYDEQMSELANILPKLDGLKGELNLADFTPGQNKIIFKEQK